MREKDMLAQKHRRWGAYPATIFVHRPWGRPTRNENYSVDPTLSTHQPPTGNEMCTPPWGTVVLAGGVVGAAYLGHRPPPFIEVFDNADNLAHRATIATQHRALWPLWSRSPRFCQKPSGTPTRPGSTRGGQNSLQRGDGSPLPGKDASSLRVGVRSPPVRLPRLVT